MRDTTDRWRSAPPAPFRYRLPQPAALPHAPRVGKQREAPRSRRSNSSMSGETTGEKNALSDSGPLRPACEEEVLTCDIRVQACPGPSATADSNLYRLADPEQRLCDQIVDEFRRWLNDLRAD